MSTPNSSIIISSTGATVVAAHLKNSVKYQVMMLAEVDGTLRGSLPVYTFVADGIGHSIGGVPAKKIHLWNADGAKIVRVTSFRQLPATTATITGLIVQWRLSRTTADDTSPDGFIIPTALDLSDGVIDPDITVHTNAALTGATEGVVLNTYYLPEDETNTTMAKIFARGGLELVPPIMRPVNGGDGIVIRPSQGLVVAQVTAAGSTSGLSDFIINFSVE